MYGFSCEHCGGMVRERRAEREALRHKGGFVILEDVPVGICERCGARYFDASVLRRVAEIGCGTAPPLRTIEVPVDRYDAAHLNPSPLSKKSQLIPSRFGHAVGRPGRTQRDLDVNRADAVQLAQPLFDLFD